MSTYYVQPGARMLWCLRRRTTDVRCILYPNGMPVEVQVVQDRELVLTELFQEEWLALNWAHAYCERLKLQGWNDSPAANPSRSQSTTANRRTRPGATSARTASGTSFSDSSPTPARATIGPSART